VVEQESSSIELGDELDNEVESPRLVSIMTSSMWIVLLNTAVPA
jgi:hypothetical protein